ncbi:phage tail family protein [Halobacillus salinarum]|uniref:Phage tail family protein n=1 Tax=Halobacillus salinarum TaxID=2932257 RepID=A0ABY4EIA0_9BACI|nr:distal tail protein Dit [Halobacillus salinarum]UOQ43349.1 phage tail family protein [Halobacillus salinarum]
MIFNQTDMSSILDVTGIRGRGLTQYELETLEIEGANGALIEDVKIPAKNLEVDVVIAGDSPEELRKNIDEINKVLSVDGPKGIVFPDEPGYTYYGMPEQSKEDEQIVATSESTIVFFREDPFKYSDEIPVDIEDNSAVNIVYDGSYPTDPIFEFVAQEDITFIQIATDEKEFMMIGRDQTPDEVTYDPDPIVLHDVMDDLGLWTTDNLVSVDGGELTGHFISDGKLFTVENYGNGSEWHGPALRRDLDNPVQDFRVEVIFTLKASSPEEIGRTELYLIGTNGKVLGKLAMKEIYATIDDGIGEVRIGDLDNGDMLVKGEGYQRRSYNQFHGKLWLRRDGNKLKAQIGEILDDGTPANRMNSPEIEITDDAFLVELNALQIHIAKTGGYPEVDRAFIHDIKVHKLVAEATNKVPVIAKKDDVIRIDHENSTITINGENQKRLKNFAADFFSFHPGDNNLYIFPASSLSTMVRYKEKRL